MYDYNVKRVTKTLNDLQKIFLVCIITLKKEELNFMSCKQGQLQECD